MFLTCIKLFIVLCRNFAKSKRMLIVPLNMNVNISTSFPAIHDKTTHRSIRQNGILHLHRFPTLKAQFAFHNGLRLQFVVEQRIQSEILIKLKLQNEISTYDGFIAHAGIQKSSRVWRPTWKFLKASRSWHCSYLLRLVNRIIDNDSQIRNQTSRRSCNQSQSQQNKVSWKSEKGKANDCRNEFSQLLIKRN